MRWGVLAARTIIAGRSSKSKNSLHERGKVAFTVFSSRHNKSSTQVVFVLGGMLMANKVLEATAASLSAFVWFCFMVVLSVVLAAAPQRWS
jgi:hypothetical protein